MFTFVLVNLLEHFYNPNHLGYCLDEATVVSPMVNVCGHYFVM